MTGPLPKVLIEVADRPVLDWKLDQLANAGATRVHLLIGFGADQIEAHLAAQPPPIPVTTHRDGPVLRGTGGALVACQSSLPDRFVVTYGDSLLDEPLRAFWEKFEAIDYQGLLSVTQQYDSAQSGNVALEGDRVAKYAKDPDDRSLTWLDYGYLALNRDVLRDYSDVKALDLGRIVSDLAHAGRLGAYRVENKFWEVGTPQSLRLVDEHLAGLSQPES